MASENYPSDQLVFLGIDVSKRTLDVCCVTLDRQSLLQQVTNDTRGFKQILSWLQGLGVTRAKVCLEATSHYSTAPAVFFYQLGWDVYLINPAVSHASLGGTQRRTKTDVADARDLAFFLEGHHRRLHAWKPLTPVYKQLRWYVRELAMTARSIAKVKVSIEKVDYMEGEAQRVIARKLQQDLKHHKKQEALLQQCLQTLIRQDPHLSARFALLTSAPGVGPVTAMSYMSEVPDPTRFRTKRELAAHAGVTPKLRHSGTHQPLSQPISKIGSQRLRSLLFMSSLTGARYNPEFRQLDLRLKARGKAPKQAKMAVARRTVEMLYSMEKHNRAYDPEYRSKKSTTVGAI